MSAVHPAAGENAMRELFGTAFAVGEPGLPDVEEVMAAVETLGAGIRHRQRVRTGIAAGALCVAGFGMVAGIAAVAHSPNSGAPMIVVPGGGSGGPAVPPAMNPGVDDDSRATVTPGP